MLWPFKSRLCTSQCLRLASAPTIHAHGHPPHSPQPAGPLISRQARPSAARHARPARLGRASAMRAILARHARHGRCGRGSAVLMGGLSSDRLALPGANSCQQMSRCAPHNMQVETPGFFGFPGERVKPKPQSSFFLFNIDRSKFVLGTNT